MQNKDEKQIWEEYCKKELAGVLPILKDLGFELEKEQPHLGGEKYLMQAVTTASGRKLILLAKRISDNKRVVIKIAQDSRGVHELSHERICREALGSIIFAYKIFFSPKEILFEKHKEHTILVQEYIQQEQPFLVRPIEEQFSLALKAFKVQEGAHATAYKHKKNIAKTFGEKTAKDYIHMFAEFKNAIFKDLPDKKNIHELLNKAEKLLKANTEIIEQYSGFLTHTDFVPHNFRIVDGDIYLLDSSSLRFGNKYEGWARFLNFMTLHNKELEEALVFYIYNNRTEEEYKLLNLMRIYRLGEIIWFYTNALKKTSGNLKVLTEARVELWASVLKALIEGRQVPEEVISGYKKTRNELRSEEEKRRQAEIF